MPSTSSRDPREYTLHGAKWELHSIYRHVVYHSGVCVIFDARHPLELPLHELTSPLNRRARPGAITANKRHLFNIGLILGQRRTGPKLSRYWLHVPCLPVCVHSVAWQQCPLREEGAQSDHAHNDASRAPRFHLRL